ncbi:60S ribosomal protein L24, mitochondrial [Termitomyces sp. J132]|nr:hypothetical protein C0989_009801 [Termitomyces sp. Mn162]KNZ73053.1 60S ribosomal protein L24, mitochondrial [Termitomyces sp. J132]
MFPTLPIFSVVSQPFKRSQLGLFQGKTKQYGNNVPFSKHKTRRTWLPNVQRKRLPSEALGEDVRVKVTTRALRTIKKVCLVFSPLVWRLRSDIIQHGGIDNYVEKSSAKVLGHEGLRLRLKIREHLAQQKPKKALKPTNQALTLADARQAREQAMKALGLESLPKYVQLILFELVVITNNVTSIVLDGPLLS